MPQFYYWDLDGTLVNSFVRNNITKAIGDVQATYSNLNSSSRKFSLTVIKRLNELAKKQGIKELDILLNKDKLIPIFQTIIDKGQKILVLWSPMHVNERYSDYVRSSPIFHICNAYLNQFIAEKHLMELEKKRINSFFPDFDSIHFSNDARFNERALAYLTEELKYGPAAIDNETNETLNRRWYKDLSQNDIPSCRFIIKNQSGKELIVDLDVKTFLKQWRHTKWPYGEDYAEDGEQFLIVLEDLYKQGIKVNFDESAQSAFAFSIQYPDDWLFQTEIDAKDISIVNDESRFLQFFKILGCNIHVANTGEAKKKQLYNSRDVSIPKIQCWSEHEMAKKYKEEKLNSFIDDIIENIQEEESERDNQLILYLKKMPVQDNDILSNEGAKTKEIASVKDKTDNKVDSTDDVEINVDAIQESTSEIENIYQSKKSASCLSNIDFCDIGMMVLMSIAGAAGGSLIGAGLGELGEEYIKTAVQTMSIGETASDTVLRVITISVPAIGALLGAGSSAIYNYGWYRFFNPPKKEMDENKKLIAHCDVQSLKTFSG